MALVESARGLRRVDDIAASHPRLEAMALGSEDFATDVGMQATPETLELPRQLLLHAARAAGIMPLGLMGSIADYRDLDALGAAAERAARFGFQGASCIHPSAVPVLNRAFSPGEQAAEAARRIVEAYRDACARGAGSITVDGRLVDAPIAERGRRLLERHRQILERNSYFVRTADE